MNKTLSAIAIIAATLTACADKTAFDVTIPVPDEYKGQTVVLLNATNNDTLGLATATDSIVSIKGKIEKPVLATAVSNSMAIATFVVEPGNITLSNEGIATGTPSNDLYAALNEEASQPGANTDSLALSFMRGNPDNPYTIVLFSSCVHLADVALIDTITAHNPELKDNAGMQKIRKFAEMRSKTSEGGKYIDFTLTDAAGKNVSLSQYVDKAKLTVVDFWASWCGPCRAEIPNLVDLYKQYKDKGLQVVGVDVWEGDEEAGPKAVKEMGIPYPIMYGGQQDVTDLYGIIGIPTILVIDSNGNIVARDVRGAELAKTVESNL